MTIALVAVALAATLHPSATCNPIANANQLWASRQIRWLVVGEQHGTEQTPAIFADLVCLASQKRHVTVAVEQPTTEQTAIDAFISSDGDATSKALFLKSLIWTNKFKDGRSSKAYFRLFENLRQLRVEGRIRNVIAIMPVVDASSGQYEKLMATNLIQASRHHMLVLALVGNVHAMKTPVSFGGPKYLPMAGVLPQESTKTLNTQANGGFQWACTSLSYCGPTAIKTSHVSRSRAVSLNGDGFPSYSGVLYLGATATMSPPVIEH